MTDIQLPDWLADMTVADIAGFLAIFVALYLIVRKFAPMSAKVVHLLDDLAGEAARPGVPARPGLMERMESVENDIRQTKTTVDTLDERLGKIEEHTVQLVPNGGSHLADRLVRIETTQRDDTVRAGRPLRDIPQGDSPPTPA